MAYGKLFHFTGGEATCNGRRMFLAVLQPLIGMTINVKDPLHWNASGVHINGGIAFMHATVFGMCIGDAHLAYKFEVLKAYMDLQIISEILLGNWLMNS